MAKRKIGVQSGDLTQMPGKSFQEPDALQIRAHLAPFGISPAEEQTARILEYIRILMAWNRSINLTSITGPVELVERHFGESMYLSNLLSVENCRLADVGSGAGFPGLPLKIAVPSIQLVLIESDKKKCAFLAEAVRVLGFSGVDILADRFEDIQPDRIRATIITSRAVGGFKELIRWSSGALAPGGELALWLGAERSTLIARTRNWTWQPPKRIPESKGRFILIGHPVQGNPTDS